MASWILLPAIGLLFYAQVVLCDDEGCPESNFIGCVTRLRIQRVPFDKNMLNVVFSVASEARLRHVCRAYSDVLPCFRDRIVDCGNDKQKRMLDEVRKMIMFFCSPFSMKRQDQFLKNSKCIGDILQMPASTNCIMDSHRLGQRINACREECYKKREFLCMMKIWISEQSLCTLIDIENRCGVTATEFYTDLQQNVFDRNFPIICDLPDNLNGRKKKITSLPPFAVVTRLPSSPSTPSTEPTTNPPFVPETRSTTPTPFRPIFIPFPTRNPFAIFPALFTVQPPTHGRNNFNGSNSIVPNTPPYSWQPFVPPTRPPFSIFGGNRSNFLTTTPRNYWKPFAPTTESYWKPFVPYTRSPTTTTTTTESSVETNNIFPAIPPPPETSRSVFRPGTWNSLKHGNSLNPKLNPAGIPLPPVQTTTRASYPYWKLIPTESTRWLPWYLRGSKSQGGEQRVGNYQSPTFSTMVYPKILWPAWSPMETAVRPTIRPSQLAAKKSYHNVLVQEYNSDMNTGNKGRRNSNPRVAGYTGNGVDSLYISGKTRFSVIILVLLGFVKESLL